MPISRLKANKIPSRNFHRAHSHVTIHHFVCEIYISGDGIEWKIRFYQITFFFITLKISLVAKGKCSIFVYLSDRANFLRYVQAWTWIGKLGKANRARKVIRSPLMVSYLTMQLHSTIFIRMKQTSDVSHIFSSHITLSFISLLTLLYISLYFIFYFAPYKYFNLIIYLIYSFNLIIFLIYSSDTEFVIDHDIT